MNPKEDSSDDVQFTISSIPSSFSSYVIVINWKNHNMDICVSLPRNDDDGSTNGIIETVAILPVWLEALKIKFLPF